MIKNNKILLSLSLLFLLAEMQLGYIIQTSKDPYNTQFFTIALACVFCFLFIEKSKSYIFTQIALIFTVCADFFLVFPDRQKQLLGMIFFLQTQMAYFLRIYFEENNRKIRKIHLITRASASVITVLATCVVLGAKTDALSLVSIFYYTNLILNVIFSFLIFKKAYILATGLVLFAICDMFIGFANIGPYMNISASSLIYKLLHSEINIAWAFYIPSQMLLAISLLPIKTKKRV